MFPGRLALALDELRPNSGDKRSEGIRSNEKFVNFFRFLRSSDENAKKKQTYFNTNIIEVQNIVNYLTQIIAKLIGGLRDETSFTLRSF